MNGSGVEIRLSKGTLRSFSLELTDKFTPFKHIPKFCQLINNVCFAAGYYFHCHYGMNISLIILLGAAVVSADVTGLPRFRENRVSRNPRKSAQIG